MSAKVQSWNFELESTINAAALDSGFHLAGVAAADAAQSVQADRMAQWVGAGYAGEMDYLKRRDADGDLLRGRLQVAIPWAQSIIVCAVNYDVKAPRSIEPARSGTGWIARYAWSGSIDPDAPERTPKPTDYHDELLTRLHRVEAVLHEFAECQTRSYVDTGPILERSFAAQAGVGWIGRNTCLINQEQGSWLLLGVIVTSLQGHQESSSPLSTTLAADRCGTCTRCIDACPTDALLGSRAPDSPRAMDASRCIAYLTIEKKGSIPEDLRVPTGRQVFGCDICQDVCPWNRRLNRPLPAPVDGMVPRMELANPALEWLAQMDSREFKRQFKGSPLERTGRKRLHRNVAIAMGNTGDPSFLPQLDLWTAGDDAVLAESAQWSAMRIRASHEEKSLPTSS